MADWVRALFLTGEASRQWHAPRTKSYTTVTYCEQTISGPLEIASDDKAEREGRCTTCLTLIAPTAPTTRKPELPKAAAAQRDSGGAAKKKRGKSPVAKRPRPTPRGRRR